MTSAGRTDPSGAVARIDAALPQTQCRRCGEADCLAYASAVADGAPIDRCPPGGREGVRRLAVLTGRAAGDVDPACGREGPRLLAWIDEAQCIGCTLCIKVCPVDCIVGAARRMHTVIEALCTGCELCVPACPVDCIHLDVATPGHSGWEAWSPEQAELARERYRQRTRRLQAAELQQAQRLAQHAAAEPHDEAAAPRQPTRQQTIAQVIARARARRG